ncbi:phosphoenolpyruvate--protein phosphotransferase [Sphaerotilus sp.]|uniref:phosphoenolpyruvate--protein phosphotransferase n=1 Tax=Sphaerotilus sp. TaxID=2093942 RepID=UPI0034E2874A
MIELSTTVRVLEGLHTRPATHMAKLAKSFDCSVELVCRGTQANAKSSVKLMLLGVKEGDEVLLRADGPDEHLALHQLMDYLHDPQSGLIGEAGAVAPAEAAPAGGTGPDVTAGPAAPNRVQGVPGSRGTALGSAYVYLPRALVAVRHVVEVEDIAAELDRFRQALAEFVRPMSEGMDDDAPVAAQDRAILQALVDVAQDEEYVGAIIRGIEAQGDAAAVTLRVGEVLAATFESMTDDYMRARAEDIRGVTRQLAAALLGQPLPDLSRIDRPSVLVAADLSAWEFSKVPIRHVRGLVCTGGSATSHVAIMARTHGIPAVLGVPLSEVELQAAQTLVVEGDTGHVIVNPDACQQAHAERQITAEREARAALQHYRDLHPRTRDGRAIEVVANLGALGEIALALDAGAMGVGLFRTELLFMQQRTLPTEHEQTEVYRQLARAFHPRPVIIRTLDIGGDKPVAGIDFPREENPFLGWRGVRMCLDRPEIFKPQLRALLRAAVEGNVRVMIPMISEIEEVRRVRQLIDTCAQELLAEGQAHASFELGIMIETPAAVLQADALAAEVAFFSIGTNDLTQYVMATDRANAMIAALYRTEHPAVMTAIEMTCQAAARAGIWVGVCGEAAANLDLLPRFIDLGVTELSMSPAAILAAKKRICEL